MLIAKFIAQMGGGEKIKICEVVCVNCTNIFFVPNIGENEPSFCAYCGTKFDCYKVKQKLYNISGFEIDA